MVAEGLFAFGDDFVGPLGYQHGGNQPEQARHQQQKKWQTQYHTGKSASFRPEIYC